MLRACLAALLCVGAEATTPAPHTPAPGVNYVCEEHNYLGDNATGNVNFQNYDIYHTECWHIECDKDVVISFANMQLYHYSYLELYTRKNSGIGTDFTLEKSFNSGHRTPPDVVLSGSVFVHFRGGYLNGWSRLEFDYVCVDATTPAPPTPAPRTPAPGVNHVCEEYNDLGDKAAGNVNFQKYDSYHTECWHIECDKEVVISFSTMQLVSNSFLYLYAGKNSGTGTDFTLEKTFYPYNARSTDVVLTGSVVVQFRSTSRHGWSRLKFDYVCTPPTDAPTSAPDTRVPEPRTRAPGVHNICDEHNDLGDNKTGNVSFQSHDNYHTECWHIECDKDVVISFSNRTQLNTYSDLHLYAGKNSGNGTDFTLKKSFNERTHTPVEVVMNGSAFVQLRTGYLNGGWARVEFDYVCVDATTPAPPTPAPRTPAPGVNYNCEENNDLGDKAAGNVSFQNYDRYHTECWHIECDKDVVISFANMQLHTYSYLDLYTGKNSVNGTDFTLEKSFAQKAVWSRVEVVLSGSAFVQFRSTHHYGRSEFEFDYECVDATTPAPPTPAPHTPAPGVNDTCEEHSNLTGTGYENLENSRSHYKYCWHIECDYDVVLKFTDIELYSHSYVSIYSSGTGTGNETNFTLEHDWSSHTSGFEGVELVVRGSAFVQFRSTYHYGRSYLAFQYECRAPTPPPQQQQCGVDTVPQRCGQGTSRACAFEVRHPARLLSVAFSGDGSRVATGAADRVVRVFDARTGVQVSQLGCADFKVHDIAFSPDNKLVALAGEGGRVVVCNAATGVLEATLMDMSASGSTPVHRVEFTRDGRYAVSGGGSDSRTRIFDVLSSDMTKASSVLDHHARDVAFSVDGAHLATVRGTEVDEVTSVWSLDGTSAVELPSVGVRVTALSFSSSAGGNVLLRGMSDGTILVSQLLDGFGGNSTGGGGDGDDNTGGDGDGNTGGDGGGNTGGDGGGNTGGDGGGNTGGDGGGNTGGDGGGNTGGDGGGNTGGDGGGNSTGGGGDGDGNTGGDGGGNTGGDGDGNTGGDGDGNSTGGGGDGNTGGDGGGNTGGDGGGNTGGDGGGNTGGDGGGNTGGDGDGNSTGGGGDGNTGGDGGGNTGGDGGGNSTGGGGDGDGNTGGDGGGNTGGDGDGNSTGGGGDGNTGGDGGGNTGGDGGGNTGGDGGGNSTGGGGDGNTGGDGGGNTGGDGGGNSTGGGGDGHGDDVGTSPWDSSVVEGVSLSLPSGIVYDSKFSRNGQKIAAVGEGDVMVWSHDGSVLHELLGHSPAILPRLDFSPDGTRLATVSRDGTLVVWKL